MPYYASFHDLQGELSACFHSTGQRLQFEEAIVSLQQQGRLLLAPPEQPRPDLQAIGGPAFEAYVDGLYFPVPLSLASPEHVVESGIFPFQRDVFVFRHPRLTRPLLHSHDFWEMEVVTRGSCLFHFEDEVFPLAEGSVILVAPGSRHDVEANDGGAVYTVMLRSSSFEASFFSLLSRDDALSLFFRNNLKRSDREPNYLLFHIQGSQELEELLGRALIECYQTDPYANSCAVSYVNLLLASLLRASGEMPDFYRYEAGADFSQILHAIRSRYRTVTLTELAGQFHYSKPHLCTLIKQNTGASFTELIRQIRMSRAAEYLLNTDLPVFEVAETVGYHSADHFTRVFRGTFGCSPQEYRRTHSGDQDSFFPFEIR